VLLGSDPDLDAADAVLAADHSLRITGELLRAAVDAVPERWLADEPGFESPGEVRAAFVAQLLARRDARDAWLSGVLAAVAERGERPAARAPNRPYWLTRERDQA
jgi:hypothetical protein